MSTIKGGDKLEAALSAIAEKIRKKAVLKVGFSDPDIALTAALNEFGVPARGQPPRPFFRNMIADKSPEWPSAIAEGLKANDYDVSKTLGQVGVAIRDQLQQSIQTFTTPALAESTVERKGFDKPLIDTGKMFQSPKFTVDE